jgi:hypothetical protein
MSKQMPLTKGQFTLVDDDDFEYLNQWRWQAHWNPLTKSYYAYRTEYRPLKKTIWMARVIINTPAGMIADHENHNTLDNQRHNLRNVSGSQNAMNRRLRADNSLGEKCISPVGNSFRVVINKGGKARFDKCFKTLDEAIRARDEKLAEIHGEFAHNGKT